MKDSILSIVESKVGSDYRIVGEHVYVKCPLALKKHDKQDDTRPSFCIHLDTGVFYCHSCGTKGCGLSLLRKAYKISGRFYPKSRDVKTLYYKEPKQQEPTIFPEHTASIFSPEGRVGFEYIRNKRNPPYTKSDIYKLLEYFDIQYCNKVSVSELRDKRDLRGYLIIPFECAGFKTFTARSTNGKTPKHFHPKGSKVGSLFLNFDKVDNETIILVEGPFDLFRMICYGYTNTVATFGKCISNEQKSLLIQRKPKLKNIIIMLDGEAKKESDKLKNELKFFFNVSVASLREDEQPDTISRTRTRIILESCFEEFNK